MNMKQKVAAGSLAVALALGGVVALAGPASAHTADFNVSAVCNTETGKYDLTGHLDLEKIPPGESGHVVFHVGNQSFSNNWNGGTFTFEGDAGVHNSNGAFTFALPSIPGTTVGNGPWTYVYTTFDQGDTFTIKSDNQAGDLKGDCKAPPSNVAINPVTQAFTCAAGTTYTVPTQDEKVKYDLPSGSVNEADRPVPGTFSLAAGQSVTITAHVAAKYLRDNGGDYNPNSYTITITGASTNTLDCHPAQQCVVTGTPYTEDGFPAFTADGLDFEGGAGHALNYLIPTSGNLQGFTSASMTIASATGYQTAYRFVLYANGNTGYTSVSAEPYINGWSAGQTGVFTITPATLVWNSHIATGPGSQSSPISITDMAALIPANQFISQGAHYGSTEPAGASTVLSHMSGCITYDKPVAPEPIPSITTDTGDVQCSVEGGGSYVITTHHFLTYPKFVAPASYTFDGQEPVKSGEDTYQTIEVGTEVCPQIVTPEKPVATDFCGVSKDTLTLPGVVDGNESETANAHYTVTANTGTSVTVTADPLEGFQFAEPGDGDTYTLDEGSAVWHFTFNNAACPLPPTTTLATTGVPIEGGVALALILLLGGALLTLRLRRVL